MTSIKEFITFLKGEGIYSLSKTEEDLKKISFDQIAKWNGLKLSFSHFLTTLYFEMLNFRIGLEHEIKKTRSKAGKVLLSDLEKDLNLVLALREEILSTGSFTNRELFILVQRKFLLKIKDLRKIMQDYMEDIQTFEQGLLTN